MPELGEYAGPVLAAYGISLALLIVIVWLSVRRSRAVKTALERVENG